MIKLNHNLNYRKFINKRDAAAEKILTNSRLRISEMMDKAFVEMIMVIQARYMVINANIDKIRNKSKIASLEDEIDFLFDKLTQQIWAEIVDLRKKTKLLTYKSEFDIIKKVTTSDKAPKLSSQSLSDSSLMDNFDLNIDPIKKIKYELKKIRKKIISAIEMSNLLDEDISKVIGRVYLALPKKKAIPRKSALKKVKTTEAIKMPVFGLALNLGNQKRSWGFEIDPATWEALIDDYRHRYIPIDRGPLAVFDILNPWNDEPMREDVPPYESFYAWEVERDITNDFVKQVRSSQIDAANHNGIDEFVVISIIDDVTCEKCCGNVGCYDFHGKLTSEVEEMTDGNYSAPPYHFNCRCTIAPTSKDLQYKPEISDEDFEQWLNS